MILALLSGVTMFNIQRKEVEDVGKSLYAIVIAISSLLERLLLVLLA